MKKFGAVAGVLVFALSVSACGSKGLDRDAAIDDIKEMTGGTTEQASCIVDEAEDTFGVEKLTSDDEPTPEEIEQITAIMSECMAE